MKPHGALPRVVLNASIPRSPDTLRMAPTSQTGFRRSQADVFTPVKISPYA